MKRRTFLSLPIVATAAACAKKEDVWLLIESVQGHLFPKVKKYPSAKEFEATRYLKMVAYHDSFDKGDLDFILRGAEILRENGYKTIMIESEKEKILQDFKENRFGNNWLSLVINYTLEALFSDSIYGGNKNEIGWKSFHHNPGIPRPTRTFGAKNV